MGVAGGRGGGGLLVCCRPHSVVVSAVAATLEETIAVTGLPPPLDRFGHRNRKKSGTQPAVGHLDGGMTLCHCASHLTPTDPGLVGGAAATTSHATRRPTSVPPSSYPLRRRLGTPCWVHGPPPLRPFPILPRCCRQCSSHGCRRHPLRAPQDEPPGSPMPGSHAPQVGADAGACAPFTPPPARPPLGPQSGARSPLGCRL